MLAGIPKEGSGTQKWEVGNLNPLSCTGLLCPTPVPARVSWRAAASLPSLHRFAAGDKHIFDLLCAPARAYLNKSSEKPEELWVTLLTLSYLLFGHHTPPQKASGFALRQKAP